MFEAKEYHSAGCALRLEWDNAKGIGKWILAVPDFLPIESAEYTDPDLLRHDAKDALSAFVASCKATSQAN